MTSTVDPITFEVLRHRLWMINDEQGKVATQISGSPVVYESKDFNSALLTAGGDSLFIGIYCTRLSLCLDVAAKTVMERFSEDPGIEDGDAFITNDPWAGASHMNDIVMVAPIFSGGRIIAWTGLTMHEIDVGGGNPGSFTVGNRDVFGEGPIISPVKLVERGRFRPDIEAWAIRNSRTAQVNALNLHARWAAISRTRRRITEIIDEYGEETFLGVQERILELTLRAFQRRLLSLPDGTWIEEGFLDHDGNSNEIYRIRVSMTKTGDRLTFDFRGTSKQAPGSVNCTRVGLEGGILSSILVALCYDMSWSPAAIKQAISIISEPGTINNALHPAGVSMATVAATFATNNVVASTIGKMLACSDFQDEAQANWRPAPQGTAINGLRRDGSVYTGFLIDDTGGGGARAGADGIDTGGTSGSPSMGIANVETYERLYPILYVYRKQGTDSGGPGRRRGGVGTETLMIPHKAGGPIDVTVQTHGASQPESRGLYGGCPSSVQVRLVLRSTSLAEAFKNSQIPNSLSDIEGYTIEPLAAKQRTLLQPDDAYLRQSAGGGGYGDPLLREPNLVEQDVRQGLVSLAVAEGVYGVSLLVGTGRLDPEATDQKRARLRAQRLSATPPAAGAGSANSGSETEVGVAVRIGEALFAYRTATGWRYSCQRCGWELAETEHPKEASVSREIPMESFSSWNRFGLVDGITIREFYCPSCAHSFGVEVRKKADPPLFDTLLAWAADKPRQRTDLG